MALLTDEPNDVIELVNERDKLLATNAQLTRDLEAAHEHCARWRRKFQTAEHDLRLAAARLTICEGRMRGCHEETGKHELLDEIASFVSETYEALAAKP